jgi:hypothetical protein
MEKESLKELTERTFAKIASPMEGNGVYAELQRAILNAYMLGKNKELIRNANLAKGSE